MKISAAVTRTPKADFVLEEVTLAEPKGTDILVKVAGCGVCHTDAAARDQELPVSLPAIFGHEGSGEVIAVGEDVKTIQPGDHVVMTFYSCLKCDNCLTGSPNMCDEYLRVNFDSGCYADGTGRHTGKDGEAIGSFFSQSSFATYCIADENNCVVIDKDVDISIMGPLGCGIQTGAGTVCNRLKPEVGSSIVIFGCGAVGLSALMMAKIMGCGTIIGVDVVESRLALAKELGATHVLNGKNVNAVEEIKKITGMGAKYSIDTTAVPELINQALYCLGAKGTCAAIGGTGDKIVPIHFTSAMMATGNTLMCVVEGDSIPKTFIPQLVRLYKAGQFPFDRLIKKYPFAQINEAFADSKKGIAIKPVVIMD